MHNFILKDIKEGIEVDMTKDAEAWCQINGYTFEQFMKWTKLAKFTGPARRKLAPFCEIKATDKNFTLVIIKNETHKGAMIISSNFLAWYLRYLEETIMAIKLMRLMGKDIVKL